MTGREWQHGFFVRDRWTVSSKLTLDLGMRWEYYPIMQRADRGIERLDFNTLEILLGGRGGNPTNLGLEAAKNNFAPRLGAVYRMNEDTVLRTGFGVTYNPIPWSRPMRGFYPLTIAQSYFNDNNFLPFASLSQGIPQIVGPDLDAGRARVPATAQIRTPEVGNIDRGTIKSWNVVIERRLPLNLAVDVAYVGTRGDGGYADLDVNAPTVIGGGNASRPYAPLGRTIAIGSWGQRLNTRYHSLQLGINRPFTQGLLLKGAYTLSKAFNESNNDEDGWTGLEWNTVSQLERNYAVAGFDRKHNFQLGFLYQLPWRSDNGTGNIAKAIINDWQVNGTFAAFSGLPFNMTANGNTLNTPSNRQTPNQVAEVSRTGEIGASGVYYDRAAWAAPVGVTFGNVGRNAFRGPGGVNVDFSIFRGFSLGGSRRIEFRGEVFNLTNTPKFGNPQGDITNGSFMQITACAGGNNTCTYPERNIRLGLRFQF